MRGALRRGRAGRRSSARGDAGVVVLDRTPFYAESGGQVGDRGELVGAGGTFAVDDTQKIQPDVFGHQGTLKTGTLKVGDKVEAAVDGVARARTMRNHSVTHLMHKALREVLGPHVQQKGSLVDADKTRFDFSHNKPMTEEQIREVEALVNARDPAQRRRGAQIMPIRRREEGRRDDAVRREVRRRGARARHRRLLARVLRRHARRAHRRHRRSSRSSPRAASRPGIRRVEAMTGERRARLGAGA